MEEEVVVVGAVVVVKAIVVVAELEMERALMIARRGNFMVAGSSSNDASVCLVPTSVVVVYY